MRSQNAKWGENRGRKRNFYRKESWGGGQRVTKTKGWKFFLKKRLGGREGGVDFGGESRGGYATRPSFL